MKTFFHRYGIPLLVSAALHAGLSIASRFYFSDTPLSPRESARARAEELEEKIEAIRAAKAAFVKEVADDIKDGTLDSMPFSLFFLRSELFEAGLKNPVAMERFPELWQTYGRQRDALRPSAPADVDLTSFLTTKKPEHAFGDPMNDYGRLIDLLQGVGYNCMARTKFHVALEHDLANNSGFRVKFVDNHIGLVTDPQLQDKGMTAPPEILVAGYLREQGVPIEHLPKELAVLYQRGVVGKDSFLKTTGIGEDLPPTGELVETEIVMGVRLPEEDTETGKRPSNHSSLRPYGQLIQGILEFYDTSSVMRPIRIPPNVDWCRVAFTFFEDFPTSPRFDQNYAGYYFFYSTPFEQLCYASQTPAHWSMDFPSVFAEQKKRIRRFCRKRIRDIVTHNPSSFSEQLLSPDKCKTWFKYYDHLPDADLDFITERHNWGVHLHYLFGRADQRLEKLIAHPIKICNPAFTAFFYSAQSPNTSFTLDTFIELFHACVKISSEDITVKASAEHLDLIQPGSLPPLLDAVKEYLNEYVRRNAARLEPEVVRYVRLTFGDARDETLLPLLATEFEQEHAFISRQDSDSLIPPLPQMSRLFRYAPLLFRYPEALGMPLDTTPHAGNHSPAAHAYLSFHRYFKNLRLLHPSVFDTQTQAYFRVLSSEEADSYVHDALIREGFVAIE